MEVGSPYFVLLAIGLGLGCAWFIHRGQREGLPRVGLIDVCIAAVVCGVLGGRLLHVVAEPLPAHSLNQDQRDALRADAARLDPPGRTAVYQALSQPVVPAVWEFVVLMPPGSARDEVIDLAKTTPDAVPARLWYWSRPAEVIMFWKGGLAYVGGLVLAVLVCMLVAWRHGIPLPEGLDLAGAAIVLGLIFGRIGCFLGGCCYGEVCEPAFWSAQPPWYGPPAGGTHRYPTALLSAANAALLFAFLRWFLARRAFKGEVFLAMLVLYAPGRFLMEAIRDDPRGGAANLSTSQIAVLVTGLPALVAWVYFRTQRGTLDIAPAKTLPEEAMPARDRPQEGQEEGRQEEGEEEGRQEEGRQEEGRQEEGEEEGR